MDAGKMWKVHAFLRACLSGMVDHERGLTGAYTGSAPERCKCMKKRWIAHSSAVVETRYAWLDGSAGRIHRACKVLKFRVFAEAVQHPDSGIENAESELAPANLIREKSCVLRFTMKPDVIHHLNDGTGQSPRKLGGKTVSAEFIQQASRLLRPRRIVVIGRKNDQGGVTVALTGAHGALRPARFFDEAPNCVSCDSNRAKSVVRFAFLIGHNRGEFHRGSKRYAASIAHEGDRALGLRKPPVEVLNIPDLRNAFAHSSSEPRRLQECNAKSKT